MIPGHIADAASRGDLETIRAYFEDDSDGARDVDDICEEETIETVTLLMLAAGGSHQGLSERSVEVARYLLSRGASVDKRTSETRQTALLLTCYSRGGNVAEMISLLLSAGADPNARNNYHRTPLGAHVRFCGTPSVECVTAMMRAGASLDRVYKEQTFEDQISYRFSVGEEGPDPESSWPKIRALAAGIRRHGSFKRYLREPHREVLALRGLAMRGFITPTTCRTRGTQQWKAAVAFLARHGDNGVVWNILSFWRATK